MAWLKVEFKWSRRQAERFIDVAENREKCATVAHFDLGVAALYLLAKAPPETLQLVGERIEAGGRPSVRALAQLTRAHPATLADPTAAIGPRLTHSWPPPDQAPTTAADMTLPPLHVRMFIRDLENIAIKLGIMIDQAVGAAALTAQDRTAIKDYCDVIADRTSTIAQSVVERPQLRIVSNNDETGGGVG